MAAEEIYEEEAALFEQVSSCFHFPNTPEQNGLAERKHRHIEEMGLTLLTQAQLPPSLSLEAFSTAVYLINRLLTPCLVSVPPMRFFLGSVPDYTHLRLFGCACYPYLGAYRKDKLSLKSIRCVFLGYSNVHKGYRSFDPSTGRGYISRHLVFDERSFPFLRSDSSPISKLGASE